jgi:outer membrane lipoprotein-sorting protein
MKIGLFLGVGLFVSLSLAGSASGVGSMADGKELLEGAKRRYEQLQSYRCKATNVIMKPGVLRDKRHFNTVEYSFAKPNSVRLTWLRPKLLQGQVAVFQGEELYVKLRFLPFAIKMDPDGWLAQDPAGNRIYQTNIGFLIDRLIDAITPNSLVTVAEPNVATSTRDTIPMVIQNDGGRVEILVDKGSELPTTIEFYGPSGNLIEACYFEDLELNVSLNPTEFQLKTKETD